MLPNQTGVPLPDVLQSQSADQVVVKEDTGFIAGTKQGGWVAPAQETRVPKGFPGRLFKGNSGARIAGRVIRLWTLFRLFGGEGDVWRI